jgi:hypothetical protein
MLDIVHLIGYSRETKSSLQIFLHWHAGSIKIVLVITRYAVINFSTQRLHFDISSFYRCSKARSQHCVANNDDDGCLFTLYGQ